MRRIQMLSMVLAAGLLGWLTFSAAARSLPPARTSLVEPADGKSSPVDPVAAKVPIASRSAMGSPIVPPDDQGPDQQRIADGEGPPIAKSAIGDPDIGGELEIEREDQPYMPGPRGPDGNALAGASNFVQVGPFRSVQVNVNAQGQNILGDAANEPSLAVSPTNHNLMVIGWRQFDNVASNFRQAGRGYSTDGGAHWTFPGVFTPGIFRSDPVLGTLTDGTILYNSLQQTFLADFFTTLDGVSWSGPISAFGGDKLWFTTDTTTGPGRDFIDCSWSTAAGCCGNNIFTRSADHAQSYLTPIPIPNSPVWGTQTIGPDGSLYIAGISGSAFRVDKSTNAQNGGQTPTFTSTIVNMGGTPSNNASGSPNPGGLLGQVWIASDHSGGPTNGNLYMVVSCNPAGTDPLDVMFVRSTNGGTTWSTPVRINTDPASASGWQWFGTMSVAPTGRIDVFWNDTRASQQATLSELYYAYSLDAGVTWSPNIRVGPQFNSTIGWPNQNKIGDYYNSVSDSAAANLAYSATYNGEQDVWFLRAGDCNHNGIHDGVDIANGTLHDANNNGIPDECENPCPADITGDHTVNVDDLLVVITHWGPCAAPCPPNCVGDVAPAGPPQGDCTVDVNDLLLVITTWGACP